MSPATSTDVAAVAGAVADLAAVTRDMAREVARIDSMDREVTEIRSLLEPVHDYYVELNKAKASTTAAAAEAETRKRATLDEWLAWLTPKRALGIITALASLFGATNSGVISKLNAALSAFLSASP